MSPARRTAGTTATLGLEQKLWAAADALRNNMDAAEYKHIVLGLIFLKYISDAFEAKHAELEAQRADGADPEDPDEYKAESIFWVPKEARWSYLKASAPQPTIGRTIDDATALQLLVHRGRIRGRVRARECRSGSRRRRPAGDRRIPTR